MSNHKNLIFFNKEGDYLNFEYNESLERFQGDILFHENSSDTFKTAAVYTLEKVPSFEFESYGELKLNKFQLFNEYGLHFYGAKYLTQSFSRIEPANNDPSFYSKWIFGTDLEQKFPIGTIIRFGREFLEFSNPLQTYTVVMTKPGAIMIISNVDNATFETNYYSQYSNPANYAGLSIIGVNCIGVYNYIDNFYKDNLSPWNEPTFYDKLYKEKKINIIDSQLNDKVVTVKNEEVTDLVHYEYSVSNLPYDGDLIIEVVSKGDLPFVYQGPLLITSDSKIVFGFGAPKGVKPGREIKIIGSEQNTNFLTIGSIPNFTGNTQQIYYGTQSLVIYENFIYECVQAYTHSSGSTIQPYNTEFWTPNVTYLPIDGLTVAENLTKAQVYFTTDRVYFQYGFTYSTAVTLAQTSEKYIEDLKLFNIDLYYKDKSLKADLIYPSKYAEVNFYQGTVSGSYSVGEIKQTRERLIEVKENLNYELNYDYSSNFLINIVFTDLDEFGLKISINKQIYEEEIAWIYSGGAPDMQRTIDKTLRRWLLRNYLRLQSLGIIAELAYTGSFVSPYFNSIKIKTEYPNVPMTLDSVRVGITANFYIEHSRVLFNDLGPNLSITINGETYEQQTVYLTGTASAYPNIPETLSEWVSTHGDYLLTFDILVTNINNLLKFDLKRLDRRFEYSINTGKINLPGIYDYTITKKIKGSKGMLITSNEVTLAATSSASFEEAGFATGMVFSINNTFHPYNNQEYVIEFLDPNVINLSYQGPYWSTTPAICNSSAFITLAFEIGFGQTACYFPPGPPGPTAGGGGEFDLEEFSSAFSLSYFNPNNYTQNVYNLNPYPGTSGMVDIIYIQLSSSIYAFGDSVIEMDSVTGNYLTTINLPGNTQSIEMEFNPINNYLYCLSKNYLWVVDPVLSTLVNTITLSNKGHQIEINQTNGDIYITYEDSSNVDIYNVNNTYVSSISNSPRGKMVFNEFESDMYVTDCLNSVVRRIDGSTRTLQTSYSIPGATNSIFYEPVNEAVYVYGASSLWKIDNGLTSSIVGISTGNFNDIIFNNLTGEMNLSDSSTLFRSLDLSSDSINLITSIGNYGYLALNQFDGDIYLSSITTNALLVISSTTGNVIHTTSLSNGSTKIVYNPDRKSVWVIQPSINSITELQVELGGTIELISSTYSTVVENNYGTLDPNYKPRPDVWLKSKEYSRRPRENFEGETPVKYYWKWFADDAPEFFIYDFSGEQLTTGNSYSYTGVKPLSPAVLNRKPNKDLEKTSSPEYQQTIFDKVEFTLSYIDDEDDISIKPRPLELFIGFKSEEEGALRSILQLYKKEEITNVFESTNINGTTIYFETLDPNGPDKRGQIKINASSQETFLEKGFKPGQIISIFIKDTTNNKNQYISNNNGLIVKIREIYYKTIIVDFFSTFDTLETEQTVVSNYPSSGLKTYLRTTISVEDKEIGRFFTFGQTEIEDIRFKTELGNVGKLIGPNEAFIFKEYDILEGGIDWPFLNKKRKEMLMMKHLIYPYIGAYKSIINAINFFGFNDLQLNEYYRNINAASPKFLKLFKLEIPDIFDNTVEGWTESEFIKNNFPNDDYEETNSFNLTYKITDKEGTNVLNYSIDEIIIKLQGLKYWLKRNIIPLTHKILDITGQAYSKQGTEIVHTTYDVQFIKNRQTLTPITFRLNEAYLLPINSGSTVYNCVVDFYSIIEDIGADKHIGPYPPPRPYNDTILEIPDYFDIKIRTYKTYKEWAPFVTYNKKDKVQYYGKLYESQYDGNKMKNPRKFERVDEWSANSIYEETNVVKYEREIYVCKSSGGTQPNLDPVSWLKITEWKEIDFEPVQTITEFRKVPKETKENPILPFNFTIDSNLDPFVVIEVTCDNGYGLIYRDKKNYEIRGLKDLREVYRYIEPIGPFQPITPVY